MARPAGMQRYLARRLLITIPILLGITIMSYFIMSLTPGDPVQMLVDPGMTQADMEIRRTASGLDQPAYVRYVKWLGELVRGNLGYSFTNGVPVARRVGERVMPTLKLTVTALAISYLIAIPVGVLVAVRRYTWVDYTATFAAFLGISLPTFFLGLAGIYVFSLRLRWLPVGGTMTLGGDGGFLDGLHHLILPASVLAVAGAGALLGWAGPTDPDVSSQYRTGGQYNFSHHSIAAMDQILDEGARTADPAKRREVYNRFQALFADELPVIVLYYANARTAVARRMSNVQTDAAGLYDFRTYTWVAGVQ